MQLETPVGKKTKELALARVAAEKKKRKRKNIVLSAIAATVVVCIGYAAGSYITTPLEAAATALGRLVDVAAGDRLPPAASK
jgi:formate/nitrite transporter FocA (FNT family)